MLGITQNEQDNSVNFPDERVDMITTEPWCIVGASVIGRGHKIDELIEITRSR